MISASAISAAKFATMFKDFPPRQKTASFTIDQAMAKMSEAASGAGHEHTERVCETRSESMSSDRVSFLCIV